MIGIVDQALYQAKELGRNRVVVAELAAPAPPAVSLTRVRSARANRDAPTPIPDAAIG